MPQFDDVYSLLGLIGSVCVIVGYSKTVSKQWEPDGVKYLVLNLCAAILLGISLIQHFNLGSMIIEVFWFYITVKALMKRYLSQHPPQEETSK